MPCATECCEVALIPVDDHTRLKKLIGPLFTRKAAASYLPFVVESAKDFCERFAAQGSFSLLPEVCVLLISLRVCAGLVSAVGCAIIDTAALYETGNES